MSNNLLCTIFSDQELNKKTNTIYFIDYHPYRICGIRNPCFDQQSGLILDFKEGYKHALEWAYSLINPCLGRNFAITIVPSHDTEKIDSPIKRLGKRLCAADSTRIDATDCLVRHTTINKLAHGGDRSLEVHFESIRVEQPELISGNQVLVLDDVQTTGNSLNACVQLVCNAGATVVRSLSIARTVS
jgi:predicted amidophosphoribosyltransferase